MAKTTTALPAGAREAWLGRFAALETFVGTHERLPQPSVLGGPEDTLHTWLQRQRKAAHLRQLPRGLVLLLQSVPGALPVPQPSAQGATVRLPRGTEKAVRDIRDFAAKHGFLPRRSTDSVHERRLNDYLYRHLERSTLDTPEAEARRQALLTVVRAYPTRREALTSDVLDAAERYVDKHGHLPPRSTKDPALERIAGWVMRTSQLLEAGSLDVDAITRARIVALLARPGKKDVEWNANLQKATAFCASHAGRPPTANEDRPLYGWLHRQHKLNRDGQLPPERLEKLRVLPGFGPRVASAA